MLAIVTMGSVWCQTKTGTLKHMWAKYQAGQRSDLLNIRYAVKPLHYYISSMLNCIMLNIWYDNKKRYASNGCDTNLAVGDQSAVRRRSSDRSRNAPVSRRSGWAGERGCGYNLGNNAEIHAKHKHPIGIPLGG